MTNPEYTPPAVKASDILREQKPKPYVTPELEALTRDYPVQRILGQNYDFLRSGRVTGMHANAMFSNSPVGNVETEMWHIGRLVVVAAESGGWTGVEVSRGWYDRFIEEGGLRGGPLKKAIEADLLDFEVLPDGKVYEVPKKGLIKFVGRRFRTLPE